MDRSNVHPVDTAMTASHRFHPAPFVPLSFRTRIVKGRKASFSSDQRRRPKKLSRAVPLMDGNSGHVKTLVVNFGHGDILRFSPINPRLCFKILN